MSYEEGLLFGLLAAWFTGMLVGANRRAWWTLLFVAPTLLSVFFTVADPVPFWADRRLDCFELALPCALAASRLWIDRHAIGRGTFLLCWVSLSLLTISAISDGIGVSAFMTGRPCGDDCAFGEAVSMRSHYFGTAFMLPAMLLAGGALVAAERAGRAHALRELSLTSRIALCLVLSALLTREFIWVV